MWPSSPFLPVPPPPLSPPSPGRLPSQRMFFYRPSSAQSHHSRGKLDHIRPITTYLSAHLYMFCIISIAVPSQFIIIVTSRVLHAKFILPEFIQRSIRVITKWVLWSLHLISLYTGRGQKFSYTPSQETARACTKTFVHTLYILKYDGCQSPISIIW